MEDEDQSGANPVAVALADMSSRYTTPEAQQLAKRTFDELYNERGEYSSEEQAQLRQLDATAQAAKDALRAAREKLLSQKYNEQAKWFALAGAFGQPSRSGRFGENLGRVGNVLSEHSIKRREFEDTRDANALKLLGDMQGIDVELVKQKLAAIKARRDADKGLMTEALKIYGKEVRPRTGGSSSMSPFGKIAADEGLMPGTPAFTARVNELYNADMKQRQQAAGVDTEEVDSQDTQILARSYGVPVANVDPFRGLSTKARQAATQRSMEQGQKALSALAAEDDTARSAIRQVDRFLALNEKQPSGPLYGIPGINWLTGWSASAQEMDQITADIARKQRQPGEGQVSNFDAQQFLKASIGRGKGFQVNKNIGTAIKVAKQLQIEQSDFLANYLAVNRHMTGAKEAWKKYIEANPIFDPKAKPGTFRLNENRTDYQTWFRSQMAPEVEEVDGDVVDEELANMTPEEREWATRPAFAKGGKVDALTRAVKSLSNQVFAPRITEAYTSPLPHADRPPPVHPALARIATDKEALLRSLVQKDLSPLDAEQLQATSQVLDTVIANAGKNADTNAGIRAEALWRMLRDMASKYKYGNGGKVVGLRGVVAQIQNRLGKVKRYIGQSGLMSDEERAALHAEHDRLQGLYEKAVETENRHNVRMQEGGQVEESPEEERARRALIAQMAREIAQGGLYNFSDEMLASLAGTESYDEALRNERAALEEFGADNPWSALGLQTLGAIPTGVGAGYAGHKALQTMKGSGPQFHPKLMKRGKAASVANLLERVLPKSAVGKMAVSGAASGAVAGAGASQGDRMADALQQSAIGTFLGPAGGLASKYGLGAARRSWDFLMGTTPKASEEKVLAALARDAPNLDEVLKRMQRDQKAGVPSMIGDAAGKNTASLTEAVAGKQGRGPGELAEKMERRQLQQGERVEDQLNRALKPSEYFGELAKLKDELYTNAKPMYEAAYKNTKPLKVSDISFLYDSKAGKQALKEAVQIMQARGIPIGKKDVLGSVNKVSLQTLDYTKQALDDMITREEGKGANYAATSMGSALRSLRDRLRGVLDNASPDYRKARAQYAGDLEVLDALRSGREQFNKMTPKQVENLVSNMSFAEKDAYRTGVAQTLFEAISKTSRGANAAARIIGTPALTQKLTHLFDKPKEAAAFHDALMREAQIWKQSQSAISNANRRRADAASEGLEETPLANAADLALDAGQQAVFLPGIAQNTGGPWTTARIMQWVRNRLPMSEQTANEVADMLGVDDPKAAREVIERLKKEGERLQQREAVSNAVTRAAGRATAVSTAPDPWAQMEEVE